jgi:hypothetical protein
VIFFIVSLRTDDARLSVGDDAVQVETAWPLARK